MPTRLLTSALMRWPNAVEVDHAFQVWAREVMSRHPEVVRVGYVGSYARGNWGVGSDLDIVIILRQTTVPFFSRLLDVTDDGLPVPADILVYTERELKMMRERGSRFSGELDQNAIWAPETRL